MNKVTSPIDRLDEACERFVSECTFDPLGYTAERSAVVDNLALSLAMSRLALTYRTPVEQQAFFETADNHLLEALGNPSARIQTWTNTGQMAAYNFDRNTGLVVVNAFPFPTNEVRALRARDAQELGLSIATRGILSSGIMNRALTDQGIERLVTDLQVVISVD